MALLQPQLVDRMVLASTYSQADEDLVETVSRWQRIAGERSMEDLFDVCLPSLFSKDFADDGDGELSKLRTFFHLNLQDIDDFMHQSTAGIRHDTTSQLGGISCPTLVLHGEEDKVVDRSLADRLAAGIRNARFRLVPHGSHFMSWEKAGAFNDEVLHFLGSKRTFNGITDEARPLISSVSSN